MELDLDAIERRAVRVARAEQQEGAGDRGALYESEVRELTADVRALCAEVRRLRGERGT